MQWYGIDLYHRRCSWSIELFVDRAYQYHDRFRSGHQQYLVKHWCFLCEWHLVGSSCEQLRSKCSAHGTLEQEPPIAICNVRPDYQLVRWRSVYVFGNCCERRHKLCLDGSNGLYYSHQQRELNCVECTEHVYNGNFIGTGGKHLRRNINAHCRSHAFAIYSGQYYRSCIGMSEPGRSELHDTCSNGCNSVVGSTDRRNHHSGPKHYEHDMHLGHCCGQCYGTKRERLRTKCGTQQGADVIDLHGRGRRCTR